jgi:hypothetical protein
MQEVRAPIFVGVRRFPVHSIFLEKLQEAMPRLRQPCGKAISKSVQVENWFSMSWRVGVHMFVDGSCERMGGLAVGSQRVCCTMIFRMMTDSLERKNAASRLPLQGCPDDSNSVLTS